MLPLNQSSFARPTDLPDAVMSASLAPKPTDSVFSDDEDSSDDDLPLSEAAKELMSKMTGMSLESRKLPLNISSISDAAKLADSTLPDNGELKRRDYLPVAQWAPLSLAAGVERASRSYFLPPSTEPLPLVFLIDPSLSAVCSVACSREAAPASALELSQGIKRNRTLEEYVLEQEPCQCPSSSNTTSTTGTGSSF